MTDAWDANIVRGGPRIRGNGPSLEDELGKLARQAEREQLPTIEKEHPALAACRKAAEMVRNVHKAHSEQSETLAAHLEQIGEQISTMCHDAAKRIRDERIMPQEMSEKLADDLVTIGQAESERQATVARGLTAARDAIVGIDAPKGPDRT